MNKTKSVGMNIDTGEKTWLTPPGILKRLGHFDLDPCVPDAMPWRTADVMVTKETDGLKSKWFGRVFLNPPYGRESIPFLYRMAEHQNGIALLFGRTDTAAWHDLVFPYCDSVLFMKERIKFCHLDGTPGETAPAPSCLVAYTQYDTRILATSGITGHIMRGERTND